jgi:hypothetical protein
MDLYVSAMTGEVLQRTLRAERAWNWIGAVIHWIYFTPLRKSWSAWNQVVWWVSLAALASSAAGTWLGIVRMMANRTAGRRGLSPFRGWMRWHHLIGLFASVVVVGWILSGWLSMDHGRLFSRGEATETEVARLSGLPLAARLQRTTLTSLRALAPASQITFNAVAGSVFLTAYGPRTQGARIAFVDPPGTPILSTLPEPLLLSGVQAVWSGAVRPIAGSGQDRLYRLAESAELEAKGFTIEGASDRRVYVDPHSGRFLAVMDSSRREYAWIYYALHTLQFPLLIDHPLLRTALVLALLALGLAASLTGVVLSVKRLRMSM